MPGAWNSVYVCSRASLKRTIIQRKFNTNIHIGQLLTDDNDPARLVELVVVAESEADLDGVLTKIGTRCQSGLASLNNVLLELAGVGSHSLFWMAK